MTAPASLERASAGRPAALPATGLLPWAPELTGEAPPGPAAAPPADPPSAAGCLRRWLRAARTPLFSVVLGGLLVGVVLDHASTLVAGLRSAVALALP
ncbi:hypothetical protein [Roseicella frigidaeris]|uniref:Uncharacterized protein n=1 Tax=Roseicella frigidaeris TaxID=2230885 RepID=A0A327MD23_9PROT|nr:hypothetical protein [Roseicella frigidaeris]RAI60890.1 hypothetical protein DOO78_01810 [Roseicella frigidaeris]